MIVVIPTFEGGKKGRLVLNLERKVDVGDALMDGAG